MNKNANLEKDLANRKINREGHEKDNRSENKASFWMDEDGHEADNGRDEALQTISKGVIKEEKERF